MTTCLSIQGCTVYLPSLDTHDNNYMYASYSCIPYYELIHKILANLYIKLVVLYYYLFLYYTNIICVKHSEYTSTYDNNFHNP